MTEEVPFFSSADLGISSSPKISVYWIGDQIHFEWDQSDPELIDAGINDMTPEQWAEVTELIEAQRDSQPQLQLRADGSKVWVFPDGSESAMEPKPKQSKPSKGFK